MKDTKQDPNNLKPRSIRWGRRFSWARESQFVTLPDQTTLTRWTWTVADSADGSMDRMVRRACCLQVSQHRNPDRAWRAEIAHLLRKLRHANRIDVASL